MTTLQTKRLILRPWKKQDLEPFAAMNADPQVMEFFPKTLSRVESDELAHKLISKMEDQGWGLWAVSSRESDNFLGFIGLNPTSFDAPFTPAIEIGWRLGRLSWGKGYATEGALACLEYAFNKLKLNEIVSFTALANEKSIRVMQRIGMHRDVNGDFDHPMLPADSPLKRHVLYRMTKEEYANNFNHRNK